MLLNEDKCQLLIIESSRISRNDIAKIKTENKTIEEVITGKLLGITLDNNLTMGEHIKRNVNRRVTSYMRWQGFPIS